MKFLLTCGGTAGHINPAIAIADALRKILPDCEILFVGSGRELENKLIPMQGYPIRNITITGFSRSRSLSSLRHNAVTLKNLAVSRRQSRKILEEFAPDAVIGTGGYVCYPVLTQAVKKGIPTLIHESNAVPGLTTQMVSDKVDRVLIAFAGTENLYKKPDRVVLTGTPVREGFETLTYRQARERLGIGQEPLVVSFWGSLGAAHMNEMMPAFIRKNIEQGAFYHVHATGGGEEGKRGLLEALGQIGMEKLPEREDIRPYIDNMPLLMSAADLVLCRAGASTISELTVKGCPAVIVPSPNVAGDHQRRNAEQLEKAGGAVMILEQDCTAEVLFDTVTELLGDKSRLQSMSKALKAIAAPGAAEQIAQMIIRMC